MAGVKILHISDLHLDRKINNLPPDKAKIRRSETLISLENVLNMHNDVDVVLIAGDLFDGECSLKSVRFTAELFAKFSHMRFFVACGNHDPYDSESIRLFESLASNNVVIFKDKHDSYYLDYLNTWIHGISFGSTSSYTSLLQGFHIKDDSAVNIMVMHGDLSSESKYNPISRSEIAESNLDYLALGHIHKHSEILNENGVRYAYSGVFEPQGFDEMNECGVITGIVDKKTSFLEFKNTSIRNFREIKLDITDVKSDEELISLLSGSVNHKDAYRIVLNGKRKYFTPDTSLINNLLDVFHMIIIDETDKNTDILDYKEEISLRGKACQHLLSIRKDENINDSVFEDACEILTNLFNKG